MKLTPLVVPLLTLMIPAFGQMRENTEPKLSCQGWQSSKYERFCEVREQKLPAMQRLDVSASPNGGVTVRGWNRQEILVRAKVEAAAPTEAQAKTLASQVQVQAGAGRVAVAGPTNLNYNDSWWTVTYEVFVPHRIDLKATSVNGGVTLSRLAGNVRGETKNGGVNVEMAGDRWQGTGLDAQTVNGGVSLHVPLNYSARIVASTHNGGIRSEFPMGSDLRQQRNVEFNLGSGGAPIRIATRNGGVSIKKKAI
ncbi:MAG: DUF4097 domain-containing protein [Bryobacteraceae bacterium]|nr:DUF4097 domain-containing protein [Bryobacteraceae bacterium]